MKALRQVNKDLDKLIGPLYKDPCPYVTTDSMGFQEVKTFASIKTIRRLYPKKKIPGPLGQEIARIYEAREEQKKTLKEVEERMNEHKIKKTFNLDEIIMKIQDTNHSM